MEQRPQDITTLLRLANDNPSSTYADDLKAQLFGLVKMRLREMAGALMRGENANHTLQATCLVDDAFVGMLNSSPQIWENSGQLYAAAFMRMKHLLIDHSRKKRRAKRDPGSPVIPLNSNAAILNRASDSPDELATTQEMFANFEAVHPAPFSVFALHHFGGYQQKEIASELGLSSAMVKRHLAFAKAYLRSELSRSQSDE